MPIISVIIPTYHDWSRLKRCLEALECQSLPRDQFEILVINNDPKDPAPNTIQKKNIKILTQSTKGSYAARNLGIDHAKAEILAFTDSDCIPDKHWLRNAEKAMRNGSERIAGRINLFYKSNCLTLAEIFEKKFAFPQDKYAQLGFSATANMITCKRFFCQFGGFRSDLFSGGDYEWGIRVYSNNIDISYLSDVIVDHPARSTVQQLVSKNRRVVGGHVVMSGYRLTLKEFINFFKCFMPPFGIWFDSYTRKDLNFFDSFKLILLYWFLSLDSSVYRLLLIAGFCESKR